MKHINMRQLTFLLTILSWLILNISLFLIQPSADAASISTIQQPAPTVTPIPTPTPIPGPSPDAQLGFIGALLAAVIAGIFGFLYIKYQARKNKEVQALQDQNQELLRRLDAASQRQQLEAEMSKLQYADMIAARREAQDRERQRRESVQASAKSVMAQAHTRAEREQAYAKALHADPKISQLQVLDMTHPMKVAEVYVRLRLH